MDEKAYEILADSHDRDLWLEMRRTMITASDVAIVMGLSRYRQPLDLYCEKLEIVPPFEGNEATEWGLTLEPVIIGEYAKRTKRETLPSGILMRSREFPFIGSTLDATTIRSASEAPIPLEIKTAGARAADDWEDGCPAHYYAQVQCQMLVTGSPVASIACLLAGQRMVWQDIDRDEDFIARMVEACRDFWRRIEEKDPPAPGSGSGPALAAMYPREVEGEVVQLGQDAVDWDERLAEVKRGIATLEDERDELTNQIKAAIGTAERGVLPGGIGVWRWAVQEKKSYEVKASTTRVLRRGKK